MAACSSPTPPRNDLLRVYPNGKVVTVARLKPRMIPWPAGLPVGPPAGTMVPSEDVATSVAVGADGYYYVGELRGFPATPGHSQVWRIAPDSVNALCDPVHPNVGACRRYADGFTSIVDLEGGPDGSIYSRPTLQRELGEVARRAVPRRGRGRGLRLAACAWRRLQKRACRRPAAPASWCCHHERQRRVCDESRIRSGGHLPRPVDTKARRDRRPRRKHKSSCFDSLRGLRGSRNRDISYPRIKD
jgi:hypothetical protein